MLVSPTDAAVNGRAPLQSHGGAAVLSVPVISTPYLIEIVCDQDPVGDKNV